jgi:hypothetical protein
MPGVGAARVANPLPNATHSGVTVVARVLVVGLLLASWSAPASAQRWKSCPKGPDGKCQWPPCEPFLADIETLATFRRKADDPRCPSHGQSSARADQLQRKVDQAEPTMTTECIAKAVPIMRRVASIDVRNSYAEEPGRAIAQVRYTNNADRTVKSATITCSAMQDDRAVAKATSVVAGPIAANATRDARVTIDLAGASFACVECELTTER